MIFMEKYNKKLYRIDRVEIIIIIYIWIGWNKISCVLIIVNDV